MLIPFQKSSFSKQSVIVQFHPEPWSFNVENDQAEQGDKVRFRSEF